MVRTCPVNALEAFRILGLRYEYLVMGLVIFIALRNQITPFGSLAAGVLAANALQKLTAHQPDGWLQQKALVWICSAKVRRYIPGISRGLEAQCLERGVIPPSGAGKVYEG